LLAQDGKSIGQSVGSCRCGAQRIIIGHMGEIQAIRQMLGHTNLPQYVGEIEQQAPYRPEEN